MSAVEFFFVGPGKTGTSWLYELVERRGLASVPSLKEPHIVDRTPAEAERLIATLYRSRERMCDFSNTYSGDADNPQRVQRHNPQARIIVTTRMPSERIISHYRYEVRRGAPDTGLDRYLEAGDALRMVERSTYRPIVQRYADVFGRERVLVLPLEQLRHDPPGYVGRLTAFLGVPPVELTAEDLAPTLERSTARVPAVARLAAFCSTKLRDTGRVRVLSAAKRSPVLSRLLYRPDTARIEASFGPSGDRVRELDRDYPAFVAEWAGFDVPHDGGRR